MHSSWSVSFDLTSTTLESYAEALLDFFAFSLDLRQKRPQSRLWFPTGFGKIARKIQSRHGVGSGAALGSSGAEAERMVEEESIDSDDDDEEEEEDKDDSAVHGQSGVLSFWARARPSDADHSHRFFLQRGIPIRQPRRKELKSSRGSSGGSEATRVSLLFDTLWFRSVSGSSPSILTRLSLTTKVSTMRSLRRRDASSSTLF